MTGAGKAVTPALILFRRSARTDNFSGEPAHHSCIAPFLGQQLALFKHFNRSRYSAFAEQRSGFAKDASVAGSFFGGIHGNQSSTNR